MPRGVAEASPGTGAGWGRLAGALREALPAAEIDGIWVFRPIRSDPREFGTAILSRVDGERRRIYTAQYALTVKGRQRGSFEWSINEVGSGPLEALQELLALAPVRGVDDEPPVAVGVEDWFPRPSPDQPDALAAD